jgi:excinuclease ABC subunit C
MRKARRTHSNRITRMIAQTASMEFVTTRSETEALLLEANLIKRLRPRFNVLLRDDKSFPYIMLTADHAAPGLFKHRGARSKKADYFGPFASAGAVGRTINALQRAFLLRTCTDSVYESRTRPCLLYQIKRCSAPCTGEISTDDYAELVDEAKAFLSGRSRAVQSQMARTMQDAAEALDFERAAVYRDRIGALTAIQSQQGINPQGIEEADVFAVHQEGGVTCVQVFFFRTGPELGQPRLFPQGRFVAWSRAMMLGAFLSQFYDDKPCAAPDPCCRTRLPRTARCSRKRSICGRRARSSILVPKRGEKRELVGHVPWPTPGKRIGRRLAETSSPGQG